MTASAANGFGQIQYAPTGTSCTEIPRLSVATAPASEQPRA